MLIYFKPYGDWDLGVHTQDECGQIYYECM